MPIRFAGRRRVVPSVTLALILVAAAVVAVARWAPWSGAELTVQVTGLPDPARGVVVVTGPGGSRSLHHGETWLTTPGIYSVTIEPVRHEMSTFHPADPAIEVTAIEGRTTETAVEYRVEIAEYTRIAPQDDSPIVAVTDTEVTLVDGPYARDLRPGHVLASAPTERVPAAFAALVESVRHREDGVVVATVVHVPLSVAMPKMVVRTGHLQTPRSHRTESDPGDVDSETGMITREIQSMINGSNDPGREDEDGCASGIAAFGYALPRLGLILDVVEHDIHWSLVDVKVGLRWPPIDVEVRKPRFFVRLALGYELGLKVDFQIERAVECKLESKRSLPVGKMCRLVSEIPKLGVLGQPGCDWGLKADLAVSAAHKVRVKADSLRRTKRFATVDIPSDNAFEMTEPRTTFPLAKGGIQTPPDSKHVGKLELNTKAGPYVMIKWSTGLTDATELGLEWDNWFAAGVKGQIDVTRDDQGGPPVVKGTLGVLYQYEIAMTFNVPDGLPLIDDHYRTKWKPRTVEIGLWEHMFSDDTEFVEGPRRRLPDQLKLPNEVGPDFTLSTRRTEPWRAAEECRYRAEGGDPGPLRSDSRRVAFRSAFNDSAWQLGVYPDDIGAQAAFDQIAHALDLCPTGAQSRPIPRPDVGGDEAFIKVFQQPVTERYGEVVDRFRPFLVARVANVIVVVDEERWQVPGRDPKAADEPLALQMRDYLAHLCAKGWWCPS